MPPSMPTPDAPDSFARRHIGPSPDERDAMLVAVGASSLHALVEETIPAPIRLSAPLALPEAEGEHAYLERLRGLAGLNKHFRSYIGLGYHDTVTPSVILRMVFENPGWYTPYTPYQAEIAQGRLESLLNFQTMVTDLTGMEVANASLLDEATAAAEAVALLHRIGSKSGTASRDVCLVGSGCFPQSIEVLRTRAKPLGIDVRVVAAGEMVIDDSVFGVVLQYPDEAGCLENLTPVIERAHTAGALVAVGTDLLALALATPPGEMGADVVYGNSQRFGVPLGFGGPHAAFFATREDYVRQVPGRVIGVSKDAHGRPAYRMALATREQHIRRERATSNICTAQALLANVAAMYGVYHGPEGLRAIASQIHARTRVLEAELAVRGVEQLNPKYFDTLRFRMPRGTGKLKACAESRGLNFRYVGDAEVGVALDETTSADDVDEIVAVFQASGATLLAEGHIAMDEAMHPPGFGGGLGRTSPFMTHPVFHSHHSETEMMRYIRRLERKDVGLDTSMIPLGSCTMKLNPATAMRPVTWPEFSRVHPYAPLDQVEGYTRIFAELQSALCAMTGLAAVSLQPNSGAQGEFAGLLVIHAYHEARGEVHRDVVLIPASAHGTNPASAAMAGLRVVVVKTAADGSVDLADLEAKAIEHRARLSCLMVTYPSTHGVFEDGIRAICDTVHAHGGQVYMDGANLNAQVGLTSPAAIGADVCHLNLHKTFAIPHGGGGPGMGPIAVAAHLAPYLPSHPMAPGRGAHAVRAISASPWGSPSILLISHAYIRMLGADGVTDATRYAILNANYVKARLAPHYPVLYARENGRVAHELIFDLRDFKEAGIDEMDVAKRLMDYGFHAPTVSFPVPGTLMVEPTESEDQGELDRFCEAMVSIRGEIEDVAAGRADRGDNVLKCAPHTAEAVAADTWTHPYSRKQAAYPLPWVRVAKFWPAVGRIDNPYGDRNLFCSCPPIDSFADLA
jgi:glycine dehydrogenase